MAIFYRDDDVVIHRNPSRQAVLNMKARTPHPLRGMVSPDGDVYVWIGETMTHADLYENHGASPDCIRIDISNGTVNLVLAGGALELLCTDDQVEELFERSSMPVTCLGDHGALAEICDMEATRLSAIRSFRRAFGDSRLVVDIDPRREEGLRTLEDIRVMRQDTEWRPKP